MNTLFFFSETFTNGYKSGSLNLIDAFCIFLAIPVIISKNPIVSVLFLIGLFLGIASHLLVSGMSFIGLSYLLVYVGAVSILFLFILMLINIRVSELLSDTSNTIPLALAISFLFMYPISQVLPYNFSSLHPFGDNSDSALDIKSNINALYEQIVQAFSANSEKGSFVTSKL